MLEERNQSWLAFRGLGTAEVKELNLSGASALRSFARKLYSRGYVNTDFTLVEAEVCFTVSSSLFLAAGLEAAA